MIAMMIEVPDVVVFGVCGAGLIGGGAALVELLKLLGKWLRGGRS